MWEVQSESLMFTHVRVQGSDHGVLSARPDAVRDEDVPGLAAHVNRWWSLAANAPGVEPHMVLLLQETCMGGWRTTCARS